MKNSQAFSLIEILVSITVTSILITFLFLGTKNYIKSGQKAAELSAGKNLISAFYAYAADNGGKLIKAMDPNPGQVFDDKGKLVMSHAAKRWPWRLAPYITPSVDILMINNKKTASPNNPMYSYLVTVFPTFGINGTFVGGKYGTHVSPDHLRNTKGNFCVINITQPHSPSTLIVFTSAKMQGVPHPGSFDVSAPGIEAIGEVDYKYSDKAVVVYFDGHVELNSREELKDMRRWSNLAAIQNNPNWEW